MKECAGKLLLAAALCALPLAASTATGAELPETRSSHFYLGLGSLAAILLIQTFCLRAAGGFLLEKPTRARSAAAAFVVDVFLYFGPLLAGLLVALLGLPSEGFVAALVLLGVIVLFAWAAVWIAGGILCVSVARAFAILLVGSILFLVIMLILWGILVGAAALVGGLAG